MKGSIFLQSALAGCLLMGITVALPGCADEKSADSNANSNATNLVEDGAVAPDTPNAKSTAKYTITVGDGTYSYTLGDLKVKQDYKVYKWNSTKTGLQGIPTSAVKIKLSSTQTYKGHYYVAAYVPTANVSWLQASYLANELGGYLACPNSGKENAFIFSMVDNGKNTVSSITYSSTGSISSYDVSNDDDDKYFWHFDITSSSDSAHHDVAIGPFLGGFQPDGSNEPDGTWRCMDGTKLTNIDGTTATYTNWAEDLYCNTTYSTSCTSSYTDSTNTDLDYRNNVQPNASGDGQPFMGFGEMNIPVATWGDYTGTVAEYGTSANGGSSYGFVMEF